MKRRGVVIPEFKEVMTPPKQEETPLFIDEKNQSISDLFTETAPSDLPASESESPEADDTSEEQNGSVQ